MTFILLLIFTAHLLHAQHVLHFTKTSGYDHTTREVSFQMFTEIAAELDVQVDDDSDGSSFSDLEVLMQYSVIVFSNTSGNAILTEEQRANFETWVAQGGRLMGIHAASDTYRHSTANGSDTGVWDFYAELLGGSVQANPHHVAGTPSYAMAHVEPHASTANLPDPWQKEEEYYYWENGYMHPLNLEVLEVEQTVGPNGQVNSYDVHRPMSWFRITDTGRVFYTALGHAASNYTSDDLFRTHIKGALAWLLDGSLVGIVEVDRFPITHFYDPSAQVIHVEVPAEMVGTTLMLYDISGRMIHEVIADHGSVRINARGWTPGTYLLRTNSHSAGSKLLLY